MGGCAARRCAQSKATAGRVKGKPRVRGLPRGAPGAIGRAMVTAPAQPDGRIAQLLDRSAERFEQARYKDALAATEEACKLAPKLVVAHHYRAAALAELGRLPDSLAAYEKALQLDPDDPDTLLSAADLHVSRL